MFQEEYALLSAAAFLSIANREKGNVREDPVTVRLFRVQGNTREPTYWKV
jgi:hypothetical protein